MHEYEIVQYLQNYNYKYIIQDHFREPSQASTNYMQNDYPKLAKTFLTGCSILSYFLRLNCCNFDTALKKSIKLAKHAKIHIPAEIQQELTAL